MSKSKGNVVNPDPLVRDFGCDSLRMYELFVGPPELDAEWNRVELVARQVADRRGNRSPEPGVVRGAAFVTPMPSSSSANCSSGSYSRDVNPAAWRSRQKSLRGFAKCAPAAAETRPGLIPQKTQRRAGARTSGTALSETVFIS